MKIMNAHESDINNIINNVSIHSMKLMKFYGYEMDFDLDKPAALNCPFYHENILISRLYRLVYLHCYAKLPIEDCFTPSIRDAEQDGHFFQNLQAANPNKTNWVRNWRVVYCYKNGVVATRKGRVRYFPQGQFLADEPRGEIRKNSKIHFFNSHEFAGLQRDFYYVFGDYVDSDIDSRKSLRVYFNLKPTKAADAISYISFELNRVHIPFTFKCLNSPALYGRADSGVLYVAKHDYRSVLRVLSELRSETFHWCEKEIPLFSLKLAPGVGMAESPDLDSFGGHCSRVIAEALYGCFEQNLHTQKLRCYEVKRALFYAGIEMASPYIVGASGYKDSLKTVSSLTNY
ncbi:T3SS effector HopA1 family protein [Enterovibrio makurazakiensis]|uniref:T3SS effector HopA1 family protein n=1 Tax=Enterovibrio makurazakiensis TaxID=2910232 RepID=UPI003D201B4E